MRLVRVCRGVLFVSGGGNRLHMAIVNTKSSLLLDFRRGAQRVPPVCFGMLLGSAGQGASK